MKATEFEPWYGKYLEVHSRSKALYQTFREVETSDKVKKYASNDLFLSESLEISFDKYLAEAEMVLAATREQSFNIDHLKFTGRYQIFDDIQDDPFSLVAGASLIQVGEPALHDPASFHHGRFEVETHLSLGKEISYQDLWLKRYYSVVLFGFSSYSPWFKFETVYQQNYADKHEIELFLRGLIGLGSRSLRLNHFKGYGPIRHRSYDVGCKYRYLLESIDSYLTVEYAYRFYAKNFPKNVNQVAVSFFYPFGLGI